MRRTMRRTVSCMTFAHRIGLAAAVVSALGLSLGACAKAPTDAGFNAYAGGAEPGSAADFAQNVGDRVFFEEDSSELTPKAQATLDHQVAWLRRYDRGRFTIEGHADERGTREYNFALGQRRAAATREYMVARGIPSGRVRTISYGKERPVATCNDISCWSQNRRAVTAILPGEGNS